MRSRAIIGLLAIAIIHILAAVVVFGQQHVPETRLVAVEQRFIPPDPIVRCSIVPGGEPVAFRTRLQRYPDTGTFWRWSPVAHHHRAAVRVIAGNGAGSGVCVATDSGVCVVLTNHHVVESHRSVIVSWPGGDRAQGQVIAIRHMDQEDVAAIIVQQPATGWFGLSIASRTPPPGTDVEMLAFGGPQYGRFRSFFARLIRGDSRVSIDAPTISGDSGSGIVWQGQVIGVNYGGPSATSAALSSDGPIPLVYPATSGCNAEFLGRWLTQSCAPWGCRPRIGPITGPQININSPQIPRGDDQFYPPSNYANPPTPTPVPDPMPSGNYCQPCQPIDVGKLRDEIVADVLSKIPKPRDGVDGKDGRDGADGMPGPPGPPGQITDAQISRIVSELSATVPTVDYDRIVAEVLTRLPPQEPHGGSDAENRILYFTSRSCSQCGSANERIEELKSRGAPITIITLSEKEAATKGVPMLWIPKTERKIVGLSNVLSYLTMVTY